MADDIPDYMRGFDLDEDWGMTPVSSAPTQKTEPTIDKKDIELYTKNALSFLDTICTCDNKSINNEEKQVHKKVL